MSQIHNQNEQHQAWVKYVREVYRRACSELVYLEMGEMAVPNKVRSSRMAWLRKRLEDMEPEQVARAVRPYLKNKRAHLDRVTEAWRQYVSEPFGTNDTYHDTYWKELDYEKENQVVSASYQLLSKQLHEQYSQETAELLCDSSFHALSGFAYQSGFLFRLMRLLQRSRILEFATLGRAVAKNPHCRSKSANFELPQGPLRLVQIFQSLPGPDSGGRSSTRTWRLLLEATRSKTAASNDTPVDVRVGELDQPPPGAHQAHPSQLDKTANHFGQINQFETFEGNQLHVSYKSQTGIYMNEEGAVPVEPSIPRKVHGSRFPPAALTGILVLLLFLLSIPPRRPCKRSTWKVFRLFKGAYRRRRLSDPQPSCPHKHPQPGSWRSEDLQSAECC